MKRVFASAMIVAVFASAASAQHQDTPAPLQAQEEQARREFQIPAQPLSSALNAFGRQAGLQVTIDSSVAAGVQSPGVSGTMTPAEALNQLLAGTGIVSRFSGNRTVLLTRPSGGAAPGAIQLDPVQVQGYPVPPQAMIDNVMPPYAGGQVATGGRVGLLGNRDVMDTPFNQTSYTSKLAQDQQARSIRDVLNNDPSVRAFFPTGGYSPDQIMIRGFFAPAPGDMGFGGLYGILPYWTVQPEIAERVEVFKGPSALLNGMLPGGALGGNINLVPKRATNEPITQATASYYSSAQFGAQVDFGRRIGSDKQFGIRFNGVYRNGDTPIYLNKEQLGMGVLALDFRGDRVRLAADLGVQAQTINGLVAYPSLAAGLPIPAPPKASGNFGQPWTNVQRQDVFGALRGEVDITENVTAYAQVGARDNRMRQYDAPLPQIFNAQGAIQSTPSFQGVFYSTLTAEGGVRSNLDTGPINHAFNLNLTTFQQSTGYGSTNGTAPIVSNLYNPLYFAGPNLAEPNVVKTGTIGFTSFAFADTVSVFDKRIQFTFGGRLQDVVTQNFATSGALSSYIQQSAFTPAVALVAKPWENVSVYFNYIEALQPGTIVGPTFSNAGTIFPPFRSKQYEAGVKVDWGKFTSTVSAFQIAQPSTITDTATNTLLLNGEQRNQGIEVNLFGEPLDGVRLLGGVMFLNAVLTSTQNGLNDGWVANNVPNVQLNLNGEWDPPFVPGLTLSGRVIYTGQQYFDLNYPRRVLPEWIRFDAGARYVIERPSAKPITIRFNVENLFDANYWSTSFVGLFLVEGAPRRFMLSTSFQF